MTDNWGHYSLLTSNLELHQCLVDSRRPTGFACFKIVAADYITLNICIHDMGMSAMKSWGGVMQFNCLESDRLVYTLSLIHI